MQIIVGSTALAYHDYNVIPKDLDIWCASPLPKQIGIDSHVIPQHILDKVPTIDGYATPNAIYTIKCSHLGWSNPRWGKHKADVLMLKHNKCILIPDLFRLLVDFWNVELGDKSFLSLNKSKEDFFTDNVEYIYDHDYLHELVAYPNPPMYTKCLKENNEVMIDKEKFDLLNFDQQIGMFREEIAVIAIERWLVNPRVKGKWSWTQAYIKSLEKTITTLTKGWATEFIILHLEHFVKPEYIYFKHPLEELL